MMLRPDSQLTIKKVIITIDLTLVLFSIWYIGLYLYTAISRLSYPFALEWVEGNTYLHVLRVLQGKPIFGPPNFEFIPMVYPPLYYYLAALVKLILKINIMSSMRFVSIIASLTVFLCLFLVCKSQNLPLTSRIAAVGLFAASYSTVGYWFDLGRVDTLALAFLFLAYVACLFGKDNLLTGAVCGLFIFLASITKQQSWVVLPFFLFFLFIQQQYKNLAALVTVLGLLGFIFIWLMNVSTHGWFLFYIFSVPSTFFNLSFKFVLVDFWVIYFFPHYKYMLLFLIFTIFMQLKNKEKRAHLCTSYLALLLVPLGIMSIFSLSHPWSWINNLMPLNSFFTIIVFILYERYKEAYFGSFLFISLLICLQFWSYRYTPNAQIPTERDKVNGMIILEKLKKLEGSVYIPTASYFCDYAGCPVHYQTTSLGDLILASNRVSWINRKLEPYISQIKSLIETSRFQAVILPEGYAERIKFTEQTGYECKKLSKNGRFRTFTGAISYLDLICTNVRE